MVALILYNQKVQKINATVYKITNLKKQCDRRCIQRQLSVEANTSLDYSVANLKSMWLYKNKQTLVNFQH